jgi:GNAT superfamily N-acetyltransferase
VPTHPVVRKATEKDLAGVLALYRELRPADPVLSPSIARDAFVSILARPDLHLIVCEMDGTLASTCMLACIPNLTNGARPFGVIEHVITLSSHRQSGYARLVLEFALTTAWQADCCKVLLLSGAQRTNAHKLYESVGFAGDVERGFVAKPRILTSTSSFNAESTSGPSSAPADASG